ncbi:MAG TPA: hypothetical protein VM911_13360 [Pyrinomonadaceae bacterium]|jgi:hypothetical protein|nr:hypothetical protein [Pyrinomonadaceae bacterium]
MTNLLSQLTSPTALLYIYLVITQMISGFYLSRDVELPATYIYLYPLGLIWIIGWWLEKDSRRHGVSWVFDMGLFLYIAWPFIMLYYLFKTRGVRALFTILAFVAIYLGAFVTGVTLYALLTP